VVVKRSQRQRESKQRVNIAKSRSTPQPQEMGRAYLLENKVPSSGWQERVPRPPTPFGFHPPRGPFSHPFASGPLLPFVGAPRPRFPNYNPQLPVTSYPPFGRPRMPTEASFPRFPFPRAGAAPSIYDTFHYPFHHAQARAPMLGPRPVRPPVGPRSNVHVNIAFLQNQKKTTIAKTSGEVKRENRNVAPSKAELDAELELFASERKRKAGIEDQVIEKVVSNAGKTETIVSVKNNTSSKPSTITKPYAPSNSLDVDLDNYWKGYKKKESTEETGNTKDKLATTTGDDDDDDDDPVLIGL